MQLITEVLHEVLRLQVLVFVARSADRAARPVTLDDLARWLRRPVEECAAMIQELQDEGMVEAWMAGPFPAQSHLRLTPVGEGWIEWMHRQGEKRPG